jgi:hypothetical protein
VEQVFSRSCAEIEAAYVRLGHQAGWRFLASSQSTLKGEIPIALITMNPGGSATRLGHGRESSERGSAYIVETWKHGYPPGQAPLQVQVRRLFAMLAEARDRGVTGDELLHTSLAAYFVPFRSPTFKALVRSRESLVFATQLWTGLFKHIDPRLTITIDQGTTRRLLRILCEKHRAVPSELRFPVGWGAYEASLFTLVSSDGSPRGILRLPHLSRFSIFGRPLSRPHVERMIQVVSSNILRESVAEIQKLHK